MKRCERSEMKLNERDARFLELAEKSSNWRMAADDSEEEIQVACKHEKKEEAAVRHSPMDAGAAFHPGSGACETADSSRQMGPQAPGGRNEGFSAGSAFDPARHQDANGDRGCGGYFNTPRSGP